MQRPLTFGYLFDFRNPSQWQQPFDRLYAENLDIIAAIEHMGFGGAWLPEHHLDRDGYMPSPLVTLAAVAARTSTIKIGTGIALAPLYHPLKFAEDCVVLDCLSQGRLELGLAIGYRQRETDAFGVPFNKRGKRFDEFLDIIKALWAGETVNHHSEHYQLTNAYIRPLPPRGDIPLYIGGFADKALERIAKYAQGYFGNEEVCDKYLDKVKQQGKDPNAMGIRLQGLFYLVADDPEKAMAEQAPYFHYVNNVYGEWMAENSASGLDGTLKPMSLEDFKKSGILHIATPDEAIQKFKAMQNKMPFEHFMMMRPPGMPAEMFLQSAELFAQKVLPQF